MTFWGSAHNDDQDVTATANGEPVEVDVAVNDDGEIRIAAWSAHRRIDVEIVFTPEIAAVLRDVLDTAIKEGVWLV